MKTGSAASTVLWLATFGFVVTRSSSRHHHPRLQSTVVVCRSNADCARSAELTGGETCHWLYDGCSVGQCMCDPVLQKRCPVTGRCINARHGGDSCESSDECPESMVCSATTRLCHCPSGHMTTDRQHCLLRRQKLIGQSCSSLTDTCLQKAVYGYTTNEAQCSDVTGSCQCVDGWRTVDSSCLSWRLHERGCSKFFQCESGAICKDKQCVCPHGFSSASRDDRRCIKNGAVRDLPLGSVCDEINEERYCASGLVCHRCVDSANTDSAFTCVKFRIAALVNGVGFYSAGSRLSMFSSCWSSTVFALFLSSAFAAGLDSGLVWR